MNGIKDQIISIITMTTQHDAHTLTIEKQCGGTPVSFESVVFNLEHKQYYTVNS